MKKEKVKIVTIGGGSSYTPELMEGFIKRYDQLPIKEIWLVDIDQGKEKLEIVGQMAQRMWDASPYEVKIHLTLDRQEALRDADFVTTQFRVGLLSARIKDERIPFSYGLLGQETNGAGGIFKALRTIPVLKQIVTDMKELCPNAWLINFTNPSGIVTEAIIKHFGWNKCIGLCNVPVMAMLDEPKEIARKSDDLIYQFTGLNHFHYHRVFDQSGAEVTSKVIDAMNSGKPSGLPKNIADVPFFKEQLEAMKMIPCGYHRYYLQAQQMLAHGLEEYRGIGTRGQQVKQTEAQLFELYRDPNLDHKPEQLTKRGGTYYSDAACECINAIYNNKQIPMVVSTKNKGALGDLDDECIVEVTSYIGATGAMPVAWGKMPSAQKGWLQGMKAMEECVIEAALSGDYGMLLEAFALNPLIQSGTDARQVLDELLVAHQAYLPQFQDTITKLTEKGITIKDPEVRQIMAQEQNNANN